jgi:sec-independent protein translocase protein TatA
MLPFMHWPELLVVLFVVILLFGAKKLPQLGSGIGKSIKEFKKEINDDSTTDTTSTGNAAQKSINAGQLEVEAIERELALKKAALEEQRNLGRTN